MSGNYSEDEDDEIQTIGKRNSKRNRRQRRISSDSSSAVEDDQHEELMSETNKEHAFICDQYAEADHPEGVSSTRTESPADLEMRRKKRKRKRIKQTGKSSSEDNDEEVVASSVDRLSDGVANLVVAENESSEQQPCVDVSEKQNETSEMNAKPSSFSLRLITKLDVEEVVGVAKLRKKIYVLRKSPTALVVYSDGKPPVHQKEIPLDEIQQPTEIAACDRTKYLYVGDRRSLSLWRLRLKSCDEAVSEMEKWMEDIENLWTFSVDACGRIVLPRNRPSDCVCVYDRDAHLLRRIFLPESLSRPGHASLGSNGRVFVSHSHTSGLSELNSSGAQVRRFPSAANGAMFFNRFLFRHFVVLNDGRVLACDGAGNGVVLLDRKLQRVEVVPLEGSGIRDPERIYHDPVKRRVITVGIQSIEIFKLVEH